MPDQEIKICAIAFARHDTKAWENGDKVIANFDAMVRGFKLNGCLLIRTARGDVVAQPPKGESQRGVRAINIIDEALRTLMTATAHGAYTAMGGKI